MINHPSRSKSEATRASNIPAQSPSRAVPNVPGWRYVAVWTDAGTTGRAAHRGAYVLAEHWDVVEGSIPASRKALKRAHLQYLTVRYDDSEQLVDKTFTAEWPEWAGYPRLASSIGRAEQIRPPTNLNEARDKAIREFFDRQFERGQFGR